MPRSGTSLAVQPQSADRIAGGLFGLLVGDALGVPYEFKHASHLPALHEIEMRPPAGFSRAHDGVPPGTWSDDGAQALCLLESLLECDGLDLGDFGSRLLRWLDEGHLAVDRCVFDCGNQTGAALARLRRGVPAHASGRTGEASNGNGALMRALPLALWHRGTDSELVRDAHRQCLPTHAHVRSQVCCALYCLIARAMLGQTGEPWEPACARLAELYRELPEHARELGVVMNSGERICPQGKGYVVDTLWSARHALQMTDYAAVVRAAIALGNDTDTTACVAGGLAGIRFGIEGIPVQWRNALRGRELLDPLVERLLQRGAAG